MSKYKYDHDCPFEAYITNLEKYNEGELIGEWVKFPTTMKYLQEVFERIGISSFNEYGHLYEEWFISDYDVYVDGMYNILGEYENLDELNFLASRIEEMNDYEYEQFEAVLEEGSYTSSVKDLINLTSNLDSFEVLTDVSNDYNLGYYYIEEAGIYDTSNMGNLSNYIDYERFGRDLALEEGGVFTDKGYVVAGRDSFVEVYKGIENIPEEYKVISAEEINEQEKSYEFNGYQVDIQINSDNDFDYTIYKNGKHLDGGIIINEQGYDSIQPYVIDDIKRCMI